MNSGLGLSGSGCGFFDNLAHGPDMLEPTASEFSSGADWHALT